MGFERKSFKRKTGLRDAKLIVIATEGEKTEKQYFDSIIVSELLKSPKIHVEVLERESSKSDPLECISSLNSFKAKYTLNKNDELWLVCDVDRWGQKKLSQVNQLCHQKAYLLAVSNPCFEAWLLLHLVDWDSYTQDQKDHISQGCGTVSQEIKKVIGSYVKTNININDFIKGIANAVDQAKKLDQPNEDWPMSFGSKIFLLIESMIGVKNTF
jgi:hypothetical protein